MVFPQLETRIYIGSGKWGWDSAALHIIPAKFVEFAFGGLGVGVYGTSDNSAKFAEFAAFGGVGVEVVGIRDYQALTKHKVIRRGK